MASTDGFTAHGQAAAVEDTLALLSAGVGVDHGRLHARVIKELVDGADGSAGTVLQQSGRRMVARTWPSSIWGAVCGSIADSLHLTDCGRCSILQASSFRRTTHNRARAIGIDVEHSRHINPYHCAAEIE